VKAVYSAVTCKTRGDIGFKYSLLVDGFAAGREPLRLASCGRRIESMEMIGERGKHRRVNALR
jgi:hypothetical protein